MQKQTRAEIETSVKKPEPRCIRISKQIRGQGIEGYQNNFEILLDFVLLACYTIRKGENDEKRRTGSNSGDYCRNRRIY